MSYFYNNFFFGSKWKIFHFCVFSSSRRVIYDGVKVIYMGNMLRILDGNSDIGAHVRSNLCYLTCFRHFARSRAVPIRFFCSEKNYFSSCVRNMSWVTIKYKYLLFDLFKAIDLIGFFSPKWNIFLHACATCPELPSNIRGMITLALV